MQRLFQTKLGASPSVQHIIKTSELFQDIFQEITWIQMEKDLFFFKYCNISGLVIFFPRYGDDSMFMLL